VVIRGTGDRSPSDSGLFSAVVAVAAGLELRSTLRRIVSAAVDLSDATYGALGVIDDAGCVTDFIYVGMDAETVAKMPAPPTGQGVLGLLVEHPLPIRIDDLTMHPASAGFPDGHPPMRSFLGVPVRVRGRVFGNLYLTEKRGAERFTAEDEQTVTALAAAAAVAIENARLFEHTRLRGRWRKALTEIDAVVFGGAGPEEVLAAAAERAREVTGADIAIVVPEVGERLPAGCVHAIALPISTPDRDHGVIQLGWIDPLRQLSTDAVTLAKEFAAQVAVTVTLAIAREEQQRLAVYEDRDRIARDLHDLVIQRLFATGMVLQGTLRTTDIPESVRERISRSVDELDETIKEIRQTIFALHEPIEAGTDSTRGLVLREVSQSAALLGFAPSVRFVGPVDSVMTPMLTDHVIAVLREALTNAAKHARAARIEVLVQFADGMLCLIVTDDGVGISENNRRSGLANINARAAELGGVCTVERVNEAGGTRLRWSVRL
jgi:signal transduction histidine kinase